MNTHTPGPWRVGMLSGGNANYVYAHGDENAVCMVYGLFLNTRLATMENIAKDRPDVAEGLANARLIAAAPDLLAALDALRDAEEQYGDPNNVAVNQALARAMEVSRRARGA